ncbi:MBL fold metallo-hydrolase [Psychrobium sp. 1_MG-2023]|uniref:MBL fold metallo-hydrolase n=1 Tax=Psychrobium sp. 1_MG-2023 TaxID=3062624 RepID=UPI000C33C9EF|nr:MBL fold metallo-hydrolase [Psychrobium sp. 1_MG-2023]MDP2561401.1 MBL fold metallo-hydrolase [Psychrobium sp. 1_MG-2023]PKF54879.1 hypothetical protein CW748_15135 [Alteromonadales bacterium alter-6D02]
MKLSSTIPLAYLLLCLPLSVAAEVRSDTVLITDLKKHYAFTKQLQKLSVTYTKQRETVFQSNKLDQPFTINSNYEKLFDLSKGQFYYHQVHHYPGNYIFNDIIVHQEGKSILYDVNGFTKGKQLQYLDYNQADFHQDLAEDIDIFSAHTFLSDADSKNTTIKRSDTWAELTKSNAEEEQLTYRFNLQPIQLVSVMQHQSKKKTEYTNPVQKMGLTYASKVRRFTKGELKSTVNITNIKEIPHIKQTMLAIPQGYGPFVDTKRKPLEWVKLANDLYLINHVAGNRHVLVKMDSKGLTLFGAPASSKVSEQVQLLINNNLPMKKIHSVYITHGHSDHMGGVGYFAEQGITVLADKYSIRALKAFPRFKKTATNWNYSTLKHKQTVNGVTFYLPKNSHSDGQSFAYFPMSEIIYQGDFLEIPFDNSLPTHMADVEKEFIEFLYSEKIAYKRIVGHHRNNNMTPEVVNAYYKAHHPN